MWSLSQSRTLARRGSDQGQHRLDHLAVGEALLPSQRAPSLEVCGVATSCQDPGLTLALCLPGRRQHIAELVLKPEEAPASRHGLRIADHHGHRLLVLAVV